MTAFMSGFWVFVGIVAGVVVQIGANLWMARRQKANAKDVLRCELEMNLAEIEKLRERLGKLKQRVTSNQLEGTEFIDMLAFDYSALQPLVQAGYFHKLLGSEGVKDYFTAMKFFNNETAQFLTQRLWAEHDQNKSVVYIQWLEEQIKRHETELKRTAARIDGKTP